MITQGSKRKNEEPVGVDARKKARTSPVCGVCDEQPSKYKCPKCRVHYCSLACFKKHTAFHDAHDAENELQDALITPNNEEEEPKEEIDTLFGVTKILTEEQKQTLGDNEDIVHTLQDKRLQQVIRTITRSRDPLKLLSRCLNENPDFYDFVDKMLRTVKVRDT
eukprot:CAMPEP_0168521362 /NCGR_PEP_ID=MMETSP0405-20121227/8620_1 /TAXON_ID=498012 /ORGANISM="Trichosphaerium sp, Strain Am-I-7 wt" /LENGTH=163 /DNA_ID=CAMNT_0008542585 /DNA_START=34 /DNA_END=521 /DNA_ORIENTATION=-